MEKTKAELYLEKVQKWREQRIKEKEERQKIKQKNVSKKETTLPVIIKAGQMKANQVKRSPVYVKATIKPSVKPVTPCVTSIERTKLSCKSTDTQIKTGIFGTKTKAPKVAAKVEKRRKSEETRQLMEKLNKWREEKKSAKKIIQKSTVKGKEVPKSHVQAGCKVVRSRLFDYQSKSKQQSSTDKRQVNKENKFVSKPATHKTEISKTGVKRRFSEVQKVNKGQQKPVGILKRKSCIGSFDLTDKNDGRSPAKRRRTSVSNTDNNNTIDNNDDVFVGNVSPCQTESDTTCKQLPISVVTPGVSTRNVRFSTPQNNHSHTDGKKLRKTPKTPATRSEELKDWLKAKGKTPSKFRHLMCFHGKKPEDEKSEDPHTKNMLTVQELSEQMDVLEQERLQLEAEKKMNSMLDECMILFEAGCPMEAIVPWLDDIYKQIPFAQNSARFYTCKANVIKSSLDLDAVLEIFEQATINNAQPKEDIAKCLTETLKYVTEGKVKEARRRCRTPRRSEVQAENVFESSAVVYTVSNVTPFSEGKRSSHKKVNTPSQCQVVTPVRRSTRRSLQNLPESLRDKKKSFSSLEEVKGEDVLFQPNLALDTALAAVEES